MVEHSTLTTTDLHEPKGVAVATSGQVYVANGSGSGTWKDGVDELVLNASLLVIGTAGQVFVVCPVAANIRAVYTVLQVVISGSDETITVKRGNGDTVGTITVAQSGSAVGDVDSLTAGLSNVLLAAGEAVEIETAGDCTGTGALGITVLVEVV